MAKDVTDGKYVGMLTPEEVIEQFEYRVQIHETYAGLVLDDPQRWAAFGDYGFHMWAINGYEWGIKYIQENNPVVYRCHLTEAIATISKAIINAFRKRG